MPVYEHKTATPRRQITVSGAEAEAAYDANPAWRLFVEERITPKQLIQIDARAIGLDDSGTVAEITARIDA
ncbi:hypothetical protein, partial [Actinophytocola sediminis]